MKNRAKNRHLLCFRPIATEGAFKSDYKNCSGDPVFTYISAGNEDNLVIPAIVSSLPKKDSSMSKVSSQRETVGRSEKKTSSRRILSRIVKAVFFETLLTQKIRNGKVGQDPYGRESNISSKKDKISDMKYGPKTSKIYNSKIDETVSDLSLSSNLISSSSLSSSCSSMASSWPISESKRSLRCLSDQNNSFPSNSFEQKQSTNPSAESKQNKRRKITGNHISSTGLCLILISLLALIFWGRICAILYTSTWLYFFWTRNRCCSEDDLQTDKSLEIQSQEDKKRVIMGGFLSRNHSRV